MSVSEFGLCERAHLLGILFFCWLDFSHERTSWFYELSVQLSLRWWRPRGSSSWQLVIITFQLVFYSSQNQHDDADHHQHPQQQHYVFPFAFDDDDKISRIWRNAYYTIPNRSDLARDTHCTDSNGIIRNLRLHIFIAHEENEMETSSRKGRSGLWGK